MTLNIIIIHCIIFKFMKKNYLSSVMKYLASRSPKIQCPEKIIGYTLELDGQKQKLLQT